MYCLSEEGLPVHEGKVRAHLAPPHNTGVLPCSADDLTVIAHPHFWNTRHTQQHLNMTCIPGVWHRTQGHRGLSELINQWSTGEVQLPRECGCKWELNVEALLPVLRPEADARLEVLRGCSQVLVQHKMARGNQLTLSSWCRKPKQKASGWKILEDRLKGRYKEEKRVDIHKGIHKHQPQLAGNLNTADHPEKKQIESIQD